MMEIVINISEQDYAWMEHMNAEGRATLATRYILYGKVLPEKHGRLIDANEVKESLRDFLRNNKTIGQCIDDTPTIIKGVNNNE